MNHTTFEMPVRPRDALLAQQQAWTRAGSTAQEADAAAEQTRMQFLRNMNHEFRTPLSIIIGMTRMALKSATDSKQAGQLGKVLHEAEHILTMVTKMLDMNRLESRQMQLLHVPFQLRAVLENLQLCCAQEARRKGLVLAFDAAVDLNGLVLQGDPLRLGQILLTLTDNAIKFTDQGRVDVRVKLVEETRSAVVLCFEVQDSGIGITAADQKRIFDLFVQLDDSSTRRHSGTGLGLALCKQLIELMGGYLGVGSQPGHGSQFYFTVHLAKAKAATP